MELHKRGNKRPILLLSKCNFNKRHLAMGILVESTDSMGVLMLTSPYSTQIRVDGGNLLYLMGIGKAVTNNA